MRACQIMAWAQGTYLLLSPIDLDGWCLSRPRSNSFAWFFLLVLPRWRLSFWSLTILVFGTLLIGLTQLDSLSLKVIPKQVQNRVIRGESLSWGSSCHRLLPIGDAPNLLVYTIRKHFLIRLRSFINYNYFLLIILKVFLIINADFLETFYLLENHQNTSVVFYNYDGAELKNEARCESIHAWMTLLNVFMSRFSRFQSIVIVQMNE